MDDLFGRQVPHNIEAEQWLLGAMLLDESCVGDVIEILKSKDFYSATNKNIFEAIYSMFSFNKRIDSVTVGAKMVEDGVWTDDVQAYLRDITVMSSATGPVKEWAHIIKDKALLRGVVEAGTEIANMAISGETGADNILEAAEKKVYSLRQDRERDSLEKISLIMKDTYNQISEAAKSGTGISGLATGFNDLDRVIMGLNNSDLIIIASRPGMGKTSIALNIALHVAKKSGKQVAIFSLEMSRIQLAMRLLSSSAFVDGKKIITGRLNEDEWKRLAESAAQISESNLLINDGAALTVTEMNAQCRRLSNLGLVIIDYMQLMTAATNDRAYRGENRVQIIGEISRMMKVMAKELNVPIICLSQLSRENEKRSKNERRPQLSDLRESGAIEQDADIVIGLYRDDYYNDDSDKPNIAECIVLKNRRGETDTIELRWDKEFTNFSSLDKYRDEP